jgi:hypothetical protein
MRRLSRVLLLTALGCGVTLAHARRAEAQVPPEPLCALPCDRSVRSARSAEYFAIHGSMLASLALGSFITGNLFPEPAPRIRAVAPSAAPLADALLLLEVTLPVPALLTTMENGEAFDAAFSYGQSLALSGVTDHVLRGPKLHSSATTAFAAAVTSSYLFDQADPVDLRIRGAFWGIQLGLAAANATLDVRAGRSRWAGALVGGTLGVGIGLLTQVAHGGSLKPSPLLVFDERNHERSHDARDHVWALSAAGVAAGIVLPLVFVPRAERDPNLEYQVIPTAIGTDGAGVLVQGKL